MVMLNDRDHDNTTLKQATRFVKWLQILIFFLQREKIMTEIGGKDKNALVFFHQELLMEDLFQTCSTDFLNYSKIIPIEIIMFIVSELMIVSS